MTAGPVGMVVGGIFVVAGVTMTVIDAMNEAAAAEAKKAVEDDAVATMDAAKIAPTQAKAANKASETEGNVDEDDSKESKASKKSDRDEKSESQGATSQA